MYSDAESEDSTGRVRHAPGGLDTKPQPHDGAEVVLPPYTIGGPRVGSGCGPQALAPLSMSPSDAHQPAGSEGEGDGGDGVTRRLTGEGSYTVTQTFSGTLFNAT